MNSPDDPALSGIEQIDATTRSSVISEKTGDYHDGIGIKEPDLDGETAKLSTEKRSWRQQAPNNRRQGQGH